MKTLVLQKSSKKTEQLKPLMTDQMWMSVKIQYGEDTYLELEDGSKITEVDKIVTILGGRLPSMQTRLRNAGKAAKKVYKKVISNEHPLADKETVEKRRAICDVCPYNQKKLFSDTCLQCGCNIRAKTTFLTEVCPEDKW